MMEFILILGIVLGSVSQMTNAKTAGFVQSTFMSTSGGTASGAAESSVVGPDGIKKGECSYTDSEGRSVKIDYEETSSGITVATTKSSHVNDAKAELEKCRGALGGLQQDFKIRIEENQQQADEQMKQFEKTFQNQMDLFNRQQQSFAQQHVAFMKQMDDFNRQIHGNLHDNIARHHQPLLHYNPVRFPMFF